MAFYELTFKVTLLYLHNILLVTQVSQFGMGVDECAGVWNSRGNDWGPPWRLPTTRAQEPVDLPKIVKYTLFLKEKQAAVIWTGGEWSCCDLRVYKVYQSQVPPCVRRCAPTTCQDTPSPWVSTLGSVS